MQWRRPKGYSEETKAGFLNPPVFRFPRNLAEAVIGQGSHLKRYQTNQQYEVRLLIWIELIPFSKQPCPWNRTGGKGIREATCEDRSRTS
jgi:hypothetical protein